jgi:hypothetical protein
MAGDIVDVAARRDADAADLRGERRQVVPFRFGVAMTSNSSGASTPAAA